MLDEYADDSTAALEAVAAAQLRHPDDYRLSRVCARVLYRRKEYDRALKAIEDVAPDLLSELSPIDRAYVFREAGISAAQTGELHKAEKFLRYAFEAAVNSGDQMKPFAAGTLGDCALVTFVQGQYDDCRDYAIRAFETVEQISSVDTLNYRYGSFILGYMVLWMRSQIDKSRSKNLDLVMWIGMCSNPEPHAEFLERPVPPPLVKWYQLAELEVDLNLGGERALDALRVRTEDKELPQCKLLLDKYLVVRAAFVGDAVRFANILPAYAFNANRALRMTRPSGSGLFRGVCRC